MARRDAYSYRQFARLVDGGDARPASASCPIVNLLGHTQYLIKVPELRDLNELRDATGQPLDRGQICPLHPRTLEIADKLLRDVAPFCTAGKVHVGLDESFHLGQCPRCRADVARARARRAILRDTSTGCTSSPDHADCGWACGRTCWRCCPPPFRCCRAT